MVLVCWNRWASGIALQIGIIWPCPGIAVLYYEMTAMFIASLMVYRGRECLGMY